MAAQVRCNRNATDRLNYVVCFNKLKGLHTVHM